MRLSYNEMANERDAALLMYARMQEERDAARRENQALLAQVQQLQRALFEAHKREQQHNERPSIGTAGHTPTGDMRDIRDSSTYTVTNWRCDKCGSRVNTAGRCPECG